MSPFFRRLQDFDLFWKFTAPMAVIFSYWWIFGLRGFNPTDDGYILSESWRVAVGQVPHLDFISARPALSALMHLPEVLLPAYMLAVSRLIVVFQLFWIAVASVEIIVRRNPKVKKTDHKVSFQLYVVAFLINANCWPIMAWHTIDGLFLSCTAFWIIFCRGELCRSQRMKWPVVFLLAGSAALVKQGFLLTPIFCLILFLIRERSKSKIDLLWIVIPSFVYLFWIRGPFNGLSDQLYSGSFKELLMPFYFALLYFSNFPGIVFLSTILILVFLKYRYSYKLNPKFLLVPPTIFVVCLLLSNTLSMSGGWTYVAPCAALLFSLSFVRDVESLQRIFVLFVMGFSISMSWGSTSPSLLTGSFIVLSILIYSDEGKSVEKFQQLFLHEKNPKVSFIARDVIIYLILFTSLFSISRDRLIYSYNEPPYSKLIYKVDSPKFKLIKMSRQSKIYLESLMRCLQKYPAAKVAIFPDNPGLYPLLSIENPFSSDWRLKQEITKDFAARTSEDIKMLNSIDGWLVLFQSYSATEISQKTFEDLIKSGEIYAHIEADKAILSRLSGVPVTCDSFSGEYKATKHRLHS